MPHCHIQENNWRETKCCISRPFNRRFNFVRNMMEISGHIIPFHCNITSHNTALIENIILVEAGQSALSCWWKIPMDCIRGEHMRVRLALACVPQSRPPVSPITTTGDTKSRAVSLSSPLLQSTRQTTLL